MALKESSKDSQDYPGAVRVHPTTREDPHRIIQELSGSSQGPGMTLQNHPRPVRVYSTTRDDPPGSSKDQDGPERIIQGLSGSSRSCQGSSNNQGGPSQDHPRIVRIIPRTRDDPPEPSKTCQGLFNNQG
jgi:hypothetical protein